MKNSYQKYKKYYHRYYLQHRKEKLVWQKKYHQENRRTSQLHHDQKVFKNLLKRTPPKNGKCELCDKLPPKWLDYHHWDKKNLTTKKRIEGKKLVKGLWVCRKCHYLSEATDFFGQEFSIKLIKKYLDFKNLCKSLN